MKINEVFTPRSSTINLQMYVARPDLEKSLTRAFERNYHTLISGESGNGKSWLYKKVLQTLGIPYHIVNFSSVARNYGGISKEILNVIAPLDFYEKTSFSDTKQAEASIPIAKGGLSHTNNYTVNSENNLLKAFKLFEKQFPNQKKIIVLDNLEAIFNNKDLMTELANIILLLDDERYSQYRVYFLIVGTPNGVLNYFRETENTESVSNRIKEIDEVRNLDLEQVNKIIKNGLNLLKFYINPADFDVLINHIYKVTLGIAQKVQEYGELLSYEIQDNNGLYCESLIENTDHEWLKEGLKECYQQIERNLNSRNTEIKRKNQVIYCIGQIENHQFDSNDIDNLIRKEFPETLPETNMGIGNILSSLSEGDSPILTKNNDVNTYSIKDPRYLMCIRVMLIKDENNRVQKLNFTQKSLI